MLDAGTAYTTGNWVVCRPCGPAAGMSPWQDIFGQQFWGSKAVPKSNMAWQGSSQNEGARDILISDPRTTSSSIRWILLNFGIVPRLLGSAAHRDSFELNYVQQNYVCEIRLVQTEDRGRRGFSGPAKTNKGSKTIYKKGKPRARFNSETHVSRQRDLVIQICTQQLIPTMHTITHPGVLSTTKE
jgi:hypothetical protein